MVERIVLRKVKNSKQLELDMVSTPNYVLKSVDWGTVKGTHHSYKYVNQVGVTVTNTSLDTRDISIEGWIVAENETQMTYLKSVLNEFVNPQEEIDLIYSDYVIRFKPDESVKYSVSFSENNDAFCKFQISGMAPNPMFSQVTENKSESDNKNDGIKDVNRAKGDIIYSSTFTEPDYNIVITPDITSDDKENFSNNPSHIIEDHIVNILKIIHDKYAY